MGGYISWETYSKLIIDHFNVLLLNRFRMRSFFRASINLLGICWILFPKRFLFNMGTLFNEFGFNLFNLLQLLLRNRMLHQFCIYRKETGAYRRQSRWVKSLTVYGQKTPMAMIWYSGWNRDSYHQWSQVNRTPTGQANFPFALILLRVWSISTRVLRGVWVKYLKYKYYYN